MNAQRNKILLAIAGTLLVSCAAQEQSAQRSGRESLTVVALGDAGEKNGNLKANASLVGRMQTGEHDGGHTDMILFLGDNFYPTGLNVPLTSVDDKAGSVLNYFEDTFTELGRDRVYAIPGNHDYYTKHAFEASALFGLINIELGPMGISDRGNERAKALPEWTYYYNMPAQAVIPLAGESTDSVAFIFFDSARLMRTDPFTWAPALDSLESLLRHSARSTGIVWRVLVVHHPFYSLGEHGGYTVWNDEIEDIERLTPCDKDSNALSWFKNVLDPEDLCADRYVAYVDSMKSIIGRNDAVIHLVLAGHDHSLQLMSYPETNPECLSCPNVHLISGAASKTTSVRKPRPPAEFTAFDPRENDGTSQTGFAQVRFEKDQIRIRFFNGRRGELINMGGGRTEMFIDRSGLLRAE